MPDPALIKMEALMFRTVRRRLRDRGYGTVAIYGAGRHTKRLLLAWRGDESLRIVCLLDDGPDRPAEKFGVPVKSLNDFSLGDADAVLLSSDAFEDKLWRAAAPLREQGVPVYRIYGTESDEPADDAPGHDSYEEIIQEISGWNPEAYYMRDGLSEQNAIVYHRYSRKHIHDQMYRALLAPLPPGASVLDIGSGRGWDTARMARLYPQFNVTGIEYAPTGVAVSRQYENERLRFVQGDATALPFADDSFDAAFSLATIEHVVGQEKMAKEAFRVLKPGGLLLIATHTEEYWRFWFHQQAVKQGAAWDFHGVKVEKLAAMLTEAGFSPAAFDGVGFVFLQFWLRYFQGIDFRKFFALQALAEWVYRGVGETRRLYYQYHLVQKPGGAPYRPPAHPAWKTALHRLAATPLYWVLEPLIVAARDRCAKLDS